jgi:NAD(P)-dependent dehydrogenase (short-subunit alcohol dehydrogenase family)
MANTAKTAIVTGASRGIGAGLVEAFLKRRYSVVANSRNITKANPFAAAANVALVDGDIGQPSTAATIVDTAVSRFGRIDVLINNAGVFIPKPFTEYTTEDFNTLVSTTLAGFLYVSQLAIKQMLRQKSGSIVNISTTLVDQPIAGVGAAVQIMLKGTILATFTSSEHGLTSACRAWSAKSPRPLWTPRTARHVHIPTLHGATSTLRSTWCKADL